MTCSGYLPMLLLLLLLLTAAAAAAGWQHLRPHPQPHPSQPHHHLSGHTAVQHTA
jgi:hypothetical protein